MARKDTHCDAFVVDSSAGGLVGAYTAARKGFSVKLISDAVAWSRWKRVSE